MVFSKQCEATRHCASCWNSPLQGKADAIGCVCQAKQLHDSEQSSPARVSQGRRHVGGNNIAGIKDMVVPCWDAEVLS